MKVICHAFKLSLFSLVLISLALFSGCGPSGVSVHGIVTLDDVPVENAMVTFVPDDYEQDPAVAWTDESGRYEIYSGSDVIGLVPGEYKVRITTYQDPVDDPEDPQPAVPERIPDLYNLKTGSI